MSETRTVRLRIPGEPAAKANQRQLVHVRQKDGTRRPLFIKSKKARQYEANVKKCVRPMAPLLEGELHATIVIWYASRRPDLDESVILDALQGLVYKNDRQVRSKAVSFELDPKNPRALVVISPRRAR